MGVYWLPIISGILGSSLLTAVYIYTAWRKRLHIKGILHFNHDGRNARPGEPQTLLDVWQLEKEHDERNKRK